MSPLGARFNIPSVFETLVHWENDNKMPLEFHLDKMGSPIATWTNKGATWTNKGQSPICPNEIQAK